MVSYVIIILLLSWLDVTLTFYQLSLKEKLNKNNIQIKEMNIIARFIIGKNASSFKYILCCIYTFSIFGFFTYIINYDMLIIGIFIGFLFSINIYHYYNLRYFYQYIL